MAVKKSRQRFYNIVLILGGVSITVWCLLGALRDGVVFFLTPSEVQERAIPVGQHIRVGGLVMPHSITYQGDTVFFTITDETKNLRVKYHGVLPALFRERQGVVLEGALQDGYYFLAKTVLAKHDENYRPPTKKLSPNARLAGNGGVPQSRSIEQ